MIARLQGKIIENEGGRLVIDTNGVGYEVFAPQNVIDELSAKTDTVNLHIRLIWRDEGPSLYGFIDSWERKLFDLLLTVSGVGPKAALALIGSIESETLAQTIALKDSKRLQKIPGIGAKTAERIVLELADKLAKAAFQRRIDKVTAQTSGSQVAEDAIEALQTLGIKMPEARLAVEAALKVVAANSPVETVIKEALKRVKTRA